MQIRILFGFIIFKVILNNFKIKLIEADFQHDVHFDLDITLYKTVDYNEYIVQWTGSDDSGDVMSQLLIYYKLSDCLSVCLSV